MQQKVAMDFQAAQGLLNNISKVYHWGINENGVTMMLKTMTVNTRMLLFEFGV